MGPRQAGAGNSLVASVGGAGTAAAPPCTGRGQGPPSPGSGSEGRGQYEVSLQVDV